MTDNSIRDLHEAALEGAIRLSIRCGKAPDANQMWAYAEGASMSWAFHRALKRLTELDPEGTAAFAADLIDDLEMGNYGDVMCDVAQELEFDSEKWCNLERTAARAGVR